jgi:hypothetical protein
MWLIIALAVIWGTVLVAWLVSRVLMPLGQSQDIPPAGGMATPQFWHRLIRFRHVISGSAFAGAADTPTIRYRQSGSDVRKGTMAVVFCVVVGGLFFRLFGGYYY